MDPMEIFLICVGLGVLIFLAFLLKFIVSRFCTDCSKRPRTPDGCILHTNSSRRHNVILPNNSRLPTIVPAANHPGRDPSRIPTTYLPLLSNSTTQSHALFRAEPSGPGEAAVFLTFNYPDDESANYGRDGLPTIQAYLPASLARRSTVSEEKHYDESRDLPPPYEDLFPVSSGRRGLNPITEEDNSV